MLNVKIIFKKEFSVILLTIWTNEVNSRIIVAEKTREDKKKKKKGEQPWSWTWKLVVTSGGAWPLTPVVNGSVVLALSSSITWI